MARPVRIARSSSSHYAKAVAKFAPFRQCRRFVGNLKSGLPSWPVFACPHLPDAGRAGGFICQFGAPPRRVVRKFPVDFTIRMLSNQVETILKSSEVMTYERKKRLRKQIKQNTP